MLTKAEFTKLAPHAMTGAYEALMSAMSRMDILTAQQQAAFLGQCHIESGGFRVSVENLSYSAKALLRVWPKSFRHRLHGEKVGVLFGSDGKGIVEEFAFKPQLIANFKYSMRNGNGNFLSGDGWAFRGRGFLQVTGRANYAAAAQLIGIDIVNDPAAAEQPEGAALVSAAWWKRNNANKHADNPQRVSRLVNRGNAMSREPAIAEEERIALTARYFAVVT